MVPRILVGKCESKFELNERTPNIIFCRKLSVAELDIAANYNVNKIQIWNRTDCWSEQLTNYRIRKEIIMLKGKHRVILSILWLIAAIGFVFVTGGFAQSPVIFEYEHGLVTAAAIK
jgi:hypothetical protein